MAESALARFGRHMAFPTPQHQAAAEATVDYFALDPRVQAVLLTCSCARGVAVPTSCVDIAVLVAPADLAAFCHEEEPRYAAFHATDPACQALARIVPWSAVDLGFCSGEFTPPYHGWTSGADEYELEIGNTLAWVHPLLQRGPRFAALQERYLPYYDEAQRQERLALVLRCAHNNLDHVVPYARRDLVEQSFKRLFHAYEETLQALFIQRRLYPIAYDKWLREQVVDILGEAALYEELRNLLALPALTTRRLADRTRRLRTVLEGLG